MTWISESQKSEIPKLINQLKDLNPQPKVYIAFKYGGNAFKSTLVSEGFDDVSVWEHGTLFDSGGTLQTHLSSLSKNSKENGGDQPSVETLAWSPPTFNWLRKISHLRNLRLKGGTLKKLSRSRVQLMKRSVQEERNVSISGLTHHLSVMRMFGFAQERLHCTCAKNVPKT